MGRCGRGGEGKMWKRGRYEDVEEGYMGICGRGGEGKMWKRGREGEKGRGTEEEMGRKDRKDGEDKIK